MAGRLPKGVVALGFVSLFMDVSSEMIHGLLPLFLTGTLGASALVLGLIEGVSEAVAQVTKVFSGALSDRMGRRKPLALLGYGLAALTKPVFALAGSAGVVLAARAVDRFGKGIRGAPRDALVADLVPRERRGAAYGLRQTMDTVGAFAGPLIAIALMAASGGNFRLVFAVAILPAAIAVLILFRGVEEPPHKASPASRPRFDRASMAALGPAFWAVTTLGAVIGFARISEAFLILQASAAGLAVALAPVVLVVMNLVYAATAWPVGILSDRIGRRGLLLLSLVVLALSHGVLALSAGVGAALAGVALWGLHMGLSQGLLSAAVADATPAALRGTGFGLFNLVGGLAVLLANALAGGLWATFGAPATFAAGAAAALLALLLALRQGRNRPDGIHSHATKGLE
ncbi:MAG: MFS transporter [Rhodobacterales bacterium 32-67-9]|nr:MAG: MFS transporter [Rhodobacterales bacterium 32-67-9]